MGDHAALVEHVRETARFYLDSSERDPRVLEALAAVDRAHFVPEPLVHHAYDDAPVSIGHRQTCSQPSMVAFMLDKLEILPGHRVLEIGSGCGYAAAVAAQLCGPSGCVFACELVPELVALMEHHLRGVPGNFRILSGDGSAGFPELAPFDRIFLSAGVAGSGFHPETLLDQLAVPGILLFPEALGSLFKLTKAPGGVREQEYQGVSFVPLVGKNA